MRNVPKWRKMKSSLNSRCRVVILQITLANFEKETIPLCTRRSALASLLMLAIWMTFVGHLTAQDEKTVAPRISGWIEKAEKSGSLKLDFYDPAKPPKPYPGWTDFDFRFKYEYEFKTRSKPGRGKSVEVGITPTFTTIDTQVSHIVRLPRTIDPVDWYETTLGSHELDHVAVGTHPRLIQLAKHLLKNFEPLNRSVAKSSEITDKWVGEIINQEVNDRQRAIFELITWNNAQLDEITRHGSRAIPDRDAFFQSLFLKENLDESGFPYLAQSLKLLETEEYLNAMSIFEKR